MKAFMEEYGVTIFAIICIVALITLASPVGKQIKTSISNVVSTFTEQGNNAADQIGTVDLSGEV